MPSERTKLERDGQLLPNLGLSDEFRMATIGICNARELSTEPCSKVIAWELTVVPYRSCRLVQNSQQRQLFSAI